MTYYNETDITLISKDMVDRDKAFSIPLQNKANFISNVIFSISEMGTFTKKPHYMF